MARQYCTLFQNEVQYFGHFVSAVGVSVGPVEICIVENWPVPKIYGPLSCYIRFVYEFATIAKPLHKLMKNNLAFYGQEFQWRFIQSGATAEFKSTTNTKKIMNYCNNFKRTSTRLQKADILGPFVPSCLIKANLTVFSVKKDSGFT